MKPKSSISDSSVSYEYRPRSLPHRFDNDRFVFITFRLKFSLPRSLMDAYHDRKIELMTSGHQSDQEHALTEDLLLFEWFDEQIAGLKDASELRLDSRAMEIVANTLRFHDKIRYHLIAYCIMPNHVHVLIYPLNQSTGDIFSIARNTYSWKRYSANQINRIYGRSGSLWQKESYDHLIRNEKELHAVIGYIIDNPVKAGLVRDWKEWPWSFRNMEVLGWSE